MLWQRVLSFRKARILASKDLVIDSIFLAQLRSGDRIAFKKLVDTYQQKVFNTAMGLLQDHSAAEDITQDVFVTVFRSLPAFNEKSSIATWIYRISVNKCLDHLRARNRRKKHGIFGQFFAAEDDQMLKEQPTFDHPGIVLERRENAKYLFEAIETLPDNQKTVFVLANIEELPQKEIAEIMDLSVKAVESLLQRAKANLRKKLEHIYDRRKNNK